MRGLTNASSNPLLCDLLVDPLSSNKTVAKQVAIYMDVAMYLRPAMIATILSPLIINDSIYWSCDFELLYIMYFV